jgi:predicted Zn finger-like uncharacterized protein
MRLVCPKCAAQYEVGEDAIPTAGRDVQCSDCGHGWFYRRPAADPDQSSTPPTAPAAPAPPAPPRKPLDEHVMAILREEALREAAARRADAARAAGQGAQAAAAVPAPPPAPPPPEAPPPPAQVPDRPAARSGLLPDIEEINSTLTADRARRGDPPTASADRRPGFRAGFALMTGLMAAAAAAYVLAPRITTLLPESAGVMTAYVGTVDDLRRQLDATVTDARQQVQSLLRSVE